MNLFMATSPFQYICANEARVAYKTKNNILLLVNQEFEPGISQQKKLVNESDWDYVIKIGRKNRALKVPAAIKKIKKIIGKSDLEHFFYAEYIGWRTRLICRNLPIKKEVYFDDGTVSIWEYEDYIRTKKPYHRTRFIQDFVVRLQGCKPIGTLEQTKNLEIFTIFNIENPIHPVIHNDFSALKDKYGTPTLFDKSAPIGFIGQNAIGHKREKTISEYIDELKLFKQKFQNDIIYFPHRTETEEVKKAIMQIGGITYHNSELPLEIELIDKKIKLSCLIGMLSTVQYSAMLLYPGMPVYSLNYKNNSNKKHQLPEKLQRRDKIFHDYFLRNGVQDIFI